MHFAGFLRIAEHLVHHFWRGRSTRGPVRFGVVGGSVGAKGGAGRGVGSEIFKRDYLRHAFADDVRTSPVDGA
jgi:hypothetical protein